MVCNGKPINVKIGNGILIFAFTLALAGTASPAWGKVSFEDITMTSGLWLQCGGPGEFQNCRVLNLAILPDSKIVVLGLAASGDVLLLIASIATCSKIKVVSIIMGILGGMCLMTCVVMDYLNSTELFDAINSIYYWAFYLTGISGGVAIIASLILIPGNNQEKMVHVV